MNPPPLRSTLFPYTTLFRSRIRPAKDSTIVTRRRELAAAARMAVKIGTPIESLSALSARSEEHTSELQSHHDLVCRLLLEKKKKKHTIITIKQKPNSTKSYS